MGDLQGKPIYIGSGACYDIRVGNNLVYSAYLGTELVYLRAGSEPSFKDMYLTFEVLSAGTISWVANDSQSAKTIEYNINNSGWMSLISATGYGATINVNAGDIVQFRGDNDEYNGSKFSTGTEFNVYGNIMSLIYSTGFTTANTLNSGSTFYGMFRGCGVISAGNLVLPATAITSRCYMTMFMGCSGLTSAPELPAMSLEYMCYEQMFEECKSLTTAPELPATALANNCYYSMFSACRSLTSAPALPATALANVCYSDMFFGCTSLTTAPELPATTLAGACYQNMFKGCRSLVKAPNLPAATLVDNCYYHMFDGCSSLSSITCFATSITANNSTTLWVDGVASAGTFVRDSASTWSVGIDGIPTGWEVVPPLPVPPSPSYDTEPLTFIISAAGDINWTDPQNNHPIEYTTDNGTTWTSVTAGTPISVSQGDVVSFRGDNSTYFTSNTDKGLFSGTTALFDVEGNIWSMIDSTGYTDPSSITLSDYALDGIFQGCDTLLSAEHLYIYSGSMASNAYAYLFRDCINLTTPPALPATTLANSCYARMFYNCTSLTSAPALPATTLANGCYQYMFRGCSSLTTAPALPATTLADNCYQQMFYGCALTTAPALPATALTNSCYYSMFQGCTGLTTAPALPATALTNSCYYGMFNGCTSLTTAPALTATTLADSCCRSMFQGCTSLTTAPELPATTLVKNCYYQMFQGCTSLNYIRCLATNISATNCTRNWVSSVAAAGTFVKDPNMTSWSTGTGGIPSGWSVQDAS